MENKCLLDTELFDFFCEQFGEIKSHEIPASAVTLLKNNAKDNTPVNDTKVFNILKAYNQCVAQQHSMHFAYRGYDALTTHTFSSNNIRSSQEILDNITKYTTSLTASITIEGNFDEGFIAINETTQEQILCDIEWRLYVCDESDEIPAEISHKNIFHTQTNIIEGNFYKLECMICDREYASQWCWNETYHEIYQNQSNHLANEIPMTTIYPDTVSYENQYFYIVTYKKTSGQFLINLKYEDTFDVYYSINDTNHWTLLTSTSLTSERFNDNTKIFFKTTIDIGNWGDEEVLNFHENGWIKEIGGNIMSLVYGDDFKNKTSVDLNYSYLFYSMFDSCERLKSAKHLILPIEHAPEYCYWDMFYNCSSLIYAPEEISAKTLEAWACNDMFGDCSSLIYAPEILAVRASDDAMCSMFYDCTSLKHVPDLHIMFCGDDACQQMFYNCISLERAPKIPILTLVSCCCDDMFEYCENLKYIDAAFMSAPSSSTNSSWVEGVAATGTFVKNVNADWNEESVRGDNGVPPGWTVVTAKPDKQYEYIVEYLQSTGTQYIDTGITPTATTGIHIYAECSNTTDSFIVGLRDTTGNTRWSIGHSSSGFYYGYGTYQNSGLTGNIAELWLNYKNDKKFKASYNGTTKTLDLPTLSFTPSNNIRLFGSAGVNASYSKWSGKLYYAEITNNSYANRTFIPVRIGTTGYMYEKTSKTLYKNAGTGSFTFGYDIIPVDYLESSGTQYIDLPITVQHSYSLSVGGEITALHPNNNTYSILSANPYLQFELKFKSYSNNINTYDSTYGNTSTNGEWQAKVGEKQSFEISALYIVSDLTYKHNSRSLYNQDISGFRIFGGYRNANRYPIKFHSIYMEAGGGYLCRLFPVKINNVGYMYDTTSGITYYGNNGTGSFICGKEIYKNLI